MVVAGAPPPLDGVAGEAVTSPPHLRPASVICTSTGVDATEPAARNISEEETEMTRRSAIFIGLLFAGSAVV